MSGDDGGDGASGRMRLTKWKRKDSGGDGDDGDGASVCCGGESGRANGGGGGDGAWRSRMTWLRLMTRRTIEMRVCWSRSPDCGGDSRGKKSLLG